jgi:hypothetical protein
MGEDEFLRGKLQARLDHMPCGGWSRGCDGVKELGGD